MEHNAIYRLVAMQQLRDQKIRVTSWHATPEDARTKAAWIVRNGGTIESMSQWEKTNWEPCGGPLHGADVFRNVGTCE